MSADMLERGGSIVIDGPLDDPRAEALAEVALRAPDPSLTVLRLDRRLWPDGPPRADLPRAPGRSRCCARARPAACRSRRLKRCTSSSRSAARSLLG